MLGIVLCGKGGEPDEKDMCDSRPAPIAIIGGGPCGLTFARLLERAGFDYIVFDRDASPEQTPQSQGGTLDLTSDGGTSGASSCGLDC
ncbi:hypothetical protein P175DRAFT_0531585 [Aspergillus ochraceoroseus IBT 24754]|uniref:FAD-binding domain-containing protein n=1 Tax=Aspergillus ochraceoroseus IBT 24754 TaxID=1392256 RepID=A0A2T5M0I9_9EURO|nr:uncharacterized protein P175DRAFT_0531585 [Aspergillus ochraceoroseus IBT 24754]PTU22039.1 hypothetical protein P175DRAFT_0531585 [Aspergillus ochraceoroseus IBT 24754]